jgi:DNA primase
VPDERDLVRARISIVDLVGQRVLLKKAGKDWKGLCPFHDDRNPSFVVSERTGSYRCWSCGAKGDIFNWVMETQKVEFREALEILAREAGVPLTRGPSPETRSRREALASAMASAQKFFRDEFARSASAREYCERRGLSEPVLLEWQIGYAPDVGDALATRLKKEGYSLSDAKDLFLVDENVGGEYFDRFRGRLMFPIHDERGTLVAFGGRLLGDGIPKYINSSDTPLYSKRRVLFGMNKAKDAIAKSRTAVLVEGYLDVIACHRAGVHGAVASLGTALGEDHAKLLKRWCDEVVVLYDADTAGQKAAERAADILQAEGLRARIALMPEGQDPDTLLRDAGPAAVQQATVRGLSPLEFRLGQIARLNDPAQDAYWQEAVLAIAKEPSQIERAKHITALSHRHPAERDPERAELLLRRQVTQAVRQLRTAKHSLQSAPTTAAVAPVDRSIHRQEIPLFLAFMDELLRRRAWEALGRDDLFLTHTGQDLARAIRASFPENPPLGEPLHWLSALEPDTARELLTDLSLSKTLKMDGNELEGAVARLERESEKRTIRHMKADENLDDAKLQDILTRLKKVSGPVEP